MSKKENRAFTYCIAYALLISLVTGFAALGPQEGAPVLVIASPFEKNSSYRVVANSDSARVLSSLRYSWTLVADTQTKPTNTLVKDLYSSGAILVLNAKPVLACANFIGRSVL